MNFGEPFTNKLSTQFPMGLISAREGLSIGYDMQRFHKCNFNNLFNQNYRWQGHLTLLKYGVQRFSQVCMCPPISANCDCKYFK